MTELHVTCELRDVAYLRDVLTPKFAEAHWEEVSSNKHYQVDLNWPVYEHLQSLNRLRIQVLFVNGEPEGYFVSVLAEHMHYRTMLQCVTDLFYISQPYRAHYTLRLFRFMEQVARESGAVRVNITYKVYKALAPIMKRLGYTPLEIVAVKHLE